MNLKQYPNLEALLEGRCGPISQWPGVPEELRALLEENKRLEAEFNRFVECCYDTTPSLSVPRMADVMRAIKVLRGKE